METSKTYHGRIYRDAKGEDEEALFLDDDPHEPFAARFQFDLEHGGRYVSVRYWINDERQAYEQLWTNQVLVMLGSVKADYTQHYSDYTGYLWTDAECTVGGHDLLAELESHEGKFCYMVVNFYSAPPDGGPS